MGAFAAFASSPNFGSDIEPICFARAPSRHGGEGSGLGSAGMSGGACAYLYGTGAVCGATGSSGPWVLLWMDIPFCTTNETMVGVHRKIIIPGFVCGAGLRPSIVW